MTPMAGRWIASLGVVLLIGGCGHRPPTTRSATSPPGAPGVATPLPVPPAQDVPTSATEGQTLASKVTRVTVYSDRARVTRQANADLTAEPTVYAFRGLPGWVDDASVQVSTNAGTLVDVRVERAFLAKATDASWRRIENDHKTVTDELAAARDEISVLDAQKTQIESIKAFSLAKVTQDTIIGDVTVKAYGDVLEFITASLRNTAAARRKAQGQVDDVTPRFEASKRRVEDAKNLQKLEETTVLVTVQAAQPTQAVVELSYMIPGVAWEPMHELRSTSADSKTVEVLSFATLTQTSGEDWGGAALSFSTQSTTRAVRVPELEALTLGDTETVTRTWTKQVSSFERAQSAFTGQSSLWNKMHDRRATERAATSFEQFYSSNMQYLQEVQGRTVSLFESLEKRGTTAQFQAQPVHSVRGDGHPVRLLIGRDRLASTQKIVAAAEQSLNAARTGTMVNSADRSLLPGNVALYQDGTFLGMTEVPFIAKGEKFSLFLGVADHIKISRELDRKRSSLVRRTRNQMQVVYVVEVENLSAQPTTLTVADRIPVSENRDIRVDRVSVSPSAKPDSKGIVRWELTLKPGEKRTLQIGYQVEYPPELTLDLKRNRAKRAAPGRSPAGATPSAPTIEERIMDLEDGL